MKSELQVDIARMIIAIMIALITKVLDMIIGPNTLLAIINLISLILFVKAVITYIEHRFDIKVLNFINDNKTVNEK